MDTRLKDVIQLKGAEDNILPPAVSVDWEKKSTKPMPRGNPKGKVTIELKAGVTPSQVDELMHEIMSETRGDRQARLDLLAQTIVEPILQIVPYVEMYTPIFFMDQGYGDLEDNSIPIEDTVAMAWETHPDGGTMFVRVGGINWTRPTFQTWDYGIEVPWDAQRFVGWNFLARQMARTAEALARKRDAIAQATLDAAIVGASKLSTVSGGVMTKASVDAVIKAQLQGGFPVARALVNPGVQTDMATWLPSTTLAQYPQNVGAEILTNLYISNYGGIEWYSNVYASSSFVYFGGLPNMIGWHQYKGTMRTVSDVDIINNRDLHKVLDAYHAWYVGNALSLRRLTILA